MASPGERLRNRLLRRFGLGARWELTDSLHQVVPQLHAVAMRLPRRQLASRFVLFITMFRRVSGLAHVDRRERARLGDTIARQLDDVYRVGRALAAPFRR